MVMVNGEAPALAASKKQMRDRATLHRLFKAYHSTYTCTPPTPNSHASHIPHHHPSPSPRLDVISIFLPQVKKIRTRKAGDGSRARGGGGSGSPAVEPVPPSRAVSRTSVILVSLVLLVLAGLSLWGSFTELGSDWLVKEDVEDVTLKNNLVIDSSPINVVLRDKQQQTEIQLTAPLATTRRKLTLRPSNLPTTTTSATTLNNNNNKIDDSNTSDDSNTPPEEDETFELESLTTEPLRPYGCPFGWHSFSPTHPTCFHVSLVPLIPLDAETKCATLAATSNIPLKSRGQLATVRSEEEQHFICQILARSNSVRGIPSKLLLGLYRSSQGNLQWRDGTEVVGGFTYWDPLYEQDLTHKIFFANCESDSGHWSGEVGNPSTPFVCSATKFPPTQAMLNPPRQYDTDENEEPPLWTRHWAPISPLDATTRQACSKMEGTNLDIQHSSPSLSRLPAQISWFTNTKKKSSEPTRFYMVWQSKGWFGWLDFWTEYITKSLDFVVAPVGKNVVVSRSASGRTGYTGVFVSPAAVERFGAHVVLSRYPIPSSVMLHFPPGTLVNQLYVDPLIHVPLGDKLELVQALDMLAKDLDCKHGAVDLGVVPESYDCSTEVGCNALLKRVHQKSNSGLWVVKGPRHGGAAVEVMSQDDVLKRFDGCDHDTVLKRQEFVQQLVDPLLLDHRKFDVRVFVLVASTKPLLVFVHREPYFRAAMAKADNSIMSTTVAGNKAQYVTNTHVQKRVALNATGGIDWQDHIWTMDRIEDYAGKAGLDPKFWLKTVFPRIKRSIRLVMVATAHTVDEVRDGQWKLFGVDFIVDKNLNPLLLDWNAFPGWDWSYRLPSTLKYRRKIISEAWRLVLDVQRGKNLGSELHQAEGFKQDGFELVYHGQHRHENEAG